MLRLRWIASHSQNYFKEAITLSFSMPYAFELRNRRDVDALQAFLEAEGVRIVDPADEYYEDYYAVFFLDPDGIKLEGMKYGELTAKRKHKPLKKKG